MVVMKLTGFLAFALAWLPIAHAHMLNMTEIQIAADADAAATVTVQIDLGQSGLMTQKSYWDAVSNSESAAENSADSFSGKRRVDAKNNGEGYKTKT